MPKHDRAAIAELPLSKLAELFNELTGQKVRKFADRKSALRRVYAALDALPPEPPATKPERASGRPPRAETRQHTPTGELRPPRPGSKRGRLLAALQADGMTAEQIAAEFDWKPRDVADALRLLASANGYVVYRAEGGETWHAAEPDR